MAVKGDVNGRAAILEAARDLFTRDGYAAVSMQQIAEAAGMTKGAPYYHFRSKDDLFCRVFEQETDRLKSGFTSRLQGDAPLEQRLVAATAYVLETTEADMLTLFSDFERYIAAGDAPHPADDDMRDEDLSESLTPFFARAAAEGFAMRSTPSRASHVFVMLTMGQLHSMRMLRSKPGAETRSAREIAAELVDVFLHGI